MFVFLFVFVFCLVFDNEQRLRWCISEYDLSFIAHLLSQIALADACQRKTTMSLIIHNNDTNTYDDNHTEIEEEEKYDDYTNQSKVV